RDKATLENIPLTDPAAPASALREPPLVRNVAQISRGVSPLEVEHRSITRVTDIYANVSGRDIASVARDIQNRLDRIQVPAGYHVAMRGEVQSMQERFPGLGHGSMMAVRLVYVLMGAD